MRSPQSRVTENRMESRLKRTLLFALALSCTLGAEIRASTVFSKADSLFLLALHEGSADAFQRVLKADPNYAPAHHELAKLYLSLDTPSDRKRAEGAIRNAIRLDPDNEQYQRAFGEILWSQGFRRDAERKYREVLKANPNNAAAAYYLGYLALKRFLKYQHMEMLGKEIFPEEERKKAENYLTQSIQADPTFRNAYYQLGLLYLESGDPNGLVRVSKQLLKQFSRDKDAFLFMGLAYQRLGEEENAYLLYSAALKRMRPEERAVMESVDYLADKDEKVGIEQAALQGQESASPAQWTDSPARERFWSKQDPLLLTDYNERRMAHYGRVAYANLRFTRPEKGISGWQTDMGKTHIKFGLPLHKWAQRPDIQLEQEVSEGEEDTLETEAQPGTTGVQEDLQISRVEHHLETWVYEDFELRFRNWNGLDAWRWEGYLLEEALEASRRGKWPGHPRETFEKKSPRYVDPYVEKKYTLPHLTVGFRDADSVRIELAYAVPRSRVKARLGADEAQADNGIFMFDENWGEVYKRVGSLPAHARAGSDSLKNSYLLIKQELHTGQGSYTLAAEVLDRVGGSIGTFRETYAFSFDNTALAMSDLLLSSDIETRVAFPENRADLRIIPNPLRTYPRNDLVFVYLEVYNLT